MGGSAATTAQDHSSRHYSAKAEIDDFMRRFLTFAKTDNVAARTEPKIGLRDGALTSADLTGALEKLDIMCSRLDIASTNAVQIEIQNEALRSLHQDRIRNHAQVLQDLSDKRLALESRCRDLELRLKTTTSTNLGRYLGAAKLSRILERDERISRCKPKPRPRRLSTRFTNWRINRA